MQRIRYGYLVTQDMPEIPDHSIVVQRYDGSLAICQGESEIIVADDHIAELIKALRTVAKDQP